MRSKLTTSFLVLKPKAWTRTLVVKTVLLLCLLVNLNPKLCFPSLNVLNHSPRPQIITQVQKRLGRRHKSSLKFPELYLKTISVEIPSHKALKTTCRLTIPKSRILHPRVRSSTITIFQSLTLHQEARATTATALPSLKIIKRSHPAPSLPQGRKY